MKLNAKQEKHIKEDMLDTILDDCNSTKKPRLFYSAILEDFQPCTKEVFAALLDFSHLSTFLLTSKVAPIFLVAF